MASIINASTSSGIVQTADTSGVLQLQTNGTATATIDTSGNVGIGISSPSGYSGAKVLDIYGTGSAIGQLVVEGGSGTNFLTAYSGNASGDVPAIYFNQGLRFGTATAKDATGFTERMRIDSSGNVMVGTTTVTSQFNIQSSGVNLLTLKSTGVTSNAGSWTFSLGSSDNFILQNNNGAGVQVTYGASSWSGYSDERLKNVTGTYTDALSGVMTLKPVKFTWKSDTENKPQVGILAQSVQPVVPEAVDAVTMNEKDKTEYLTIRYTELIPILTAAIQELKAIVDAQATEITTLQTQVKALTPATGGTA
jgi:hypothetical protein